MKFEVAPETPALDTESALAYTRERGKANAQAQTGPGLEVIRRSTASFPDGDDQLAPHVSFAAARERSG